MKKNEFERVLKYLVEKICLEAQEILLSGRSTGFRDYVAETYNSDPEAEICFCFSHGEADKRRICFYNGYTWIVLTNGDPEIHEEDPEPKEE